MALTILFGCVVVAGVGMAIAPGAKPGVRATGIAIFIGGGAIIRRVRESGVRVVDDGIVVCQFFRTRQIPWSDISGFRVGPGSNVAQRLTHCSSISRMTGNCAFKRCPQAFRSMGHEVTCTTQPIC